MTKQVTLENTLAGGFGLPTGQIVPGNGSILVEPEIWEASKDHPVVAARVKAGTIIVDGQGKKSGKPSADNTALQARVVELEGLLKAANDEITALKADSNGQGGAGGGIASAYTVTDKGSGWFAITQDGLEVTKSLRKDVVDGFADLDAEKQKALVEANKAD